MVLNNLNALLARLPALAMPTGQKRVWLTDFLAGTMVFNFVALAEYALVAHGMVVRAKKKEAADAQKAKADATSEKGVAVEVAGADNAKHETLCLHELRAALADLDHLFHWLFPLCYIIFCAIMFGIHDNYVSSDGCSLDTPE